VLNGLFLNEDGVIPEGIPFIKICAWDGFDFTFIVHNLIFCNVIFTGIFEAGTFTVFVTGA
jgi:hypothetical protein